LLGLAAAPLQAQPLPAPARPHAEPPVTVPERRPARPPEVQAPAAPVAVPPGAEQVRVTVTDVQVEGSTVYAPEALREGYAALIGREVSLADVFGIAEGIQRRYRDDGYVLTRVVVPPQKVTDGVFRLRVIEGFVSQVSVEGDVGPVGARVQAYLDRITAARPVRQQDLERYLLLVSDLPGVTALGVLRPGAGEVGAAELVVRVERDPFEGFALANNRGSRYTGVGRAALSLQENAATAFGERLRGLFVTTVGDDEERYGQIAYDQALGSEGLRLRATANYDRTRPGQDLDRFDVEGETRSGDLSAVYPVLRSRALSLYVEGGLQASDTEQEALGERLARDRLRVVYAGVTTDLLDRWGGRSTVGASLRQGLDALGASAEGDPDLSRAEGVPDATVLRVRAERYQPFGTTPWGLFAAVKGQYAWDPLLVDEEASFGGETFGRGYDPSEVAGDQGAGMMLEVQYTRAVDTPWLRGYQAYGFYDLGAVWNEDEGAEDPSLASAGLGVRSQLRGGAFLDLEVAKPLTRTPGTRDDKDPFLYLQLTVAF
jgi:hemolysin activation/secretion protein